jgi:hypothetical protein
MTIHTDVQNVLDRIKTAQQQPLGDPRFKSLEKSTFTQSASATSGLTFYDLELGAKFLYPVLTPLRNMIPRVSGKGGIQAAWRAITAINTTGLRFGVSSANRGARMIIRRPTRASASRRVLISRRNMPARILTMSAPSAPRQASRP